MRGNSGKLVAAALEWLVVALGTLLLAVQLLGPDPRVVDDDFGVFYAGAQAIVARQSPYVGDFVSPPWFALWLAPLVALPESVARSAWLIANGLMLVATSRLCVGLVGLPWPWRRVLLAAIVFALWPPIAFGLRLGQNSLLVWLLLLLGLLSLRAGRPRLAGALLACSLVKPQLAMWLVGGAAVWLYRRGALMPFAAGAVGTLAGLALLVALVAPSSYADVWELRPRPWNYWGSTVALPPLLAELLGSPWLGLAVYAPVALIAAVLLLRAWGAAHADLATLSALTACATLVVTPYAYSYDAVMLQLPVCWLLARARSATLPHYLAPLVAVSGAAALWLLERPADYTAGRFLGLLPPLGLLVVVLLVQHRSARSPFVPDPVTPPRRVPG